MTDPPFDVPKASRFFAIEANNLAWSLIEAAERTDEDAERMIHAAHASLYHWSQVGTAINRQRGLCLVATAYAAAGRGEEAGHYARLCLEMSRADGIGQTAFDRATAYGCAAAAAARVGRADDARRLHAAATEAAAGFEDAEDRAVFEKLYPAP